MSDAALPLQTALYDALTGDGVLMALVSAIYDHVPADAALPYVQIGEATVGDWSAIGLAGEEHALTLHVWTADHGLRSAKTIMGEVKRVLDGAALAVAGHHLVMLAFTFGQTLREEDGRIQHGVLRFRATLHSI
jgi:hypothetical protein